jgi:hypothetical protein
MCKVRGTTITYHSGTVQYYYYCTTSSSSVELVIMYSTRTQYSIVGVEDYNRA